MGNKGRNFVASARDNTKIFDEKTPAAGVQQVEVATPKPITYDIGESKGITYNTEEPEEYVGVVEGVQMYLNIRENPSLAAGIVTMLKEGSKLKVVDKCEGSDFYKVKVEEPKVDGYAMKKYVKLT